MVEDMRTFIMSTLRSTRCRLRTITDRLYLKPKHREMLVSLLREHLPGVEVWTE